MERKSRESFRWKGRVERVSGGKEEKRGFRVERKSRESFRWKGREKRVPGGKEE